MGDENRSAGKDAGSDPTLPAPAAGAFASSGTTPLLSVDQIVDGRYRVIRALDQGGMGQVFEVEHLTLGSRHALKIYHPASGSTPAAQFATRFVEEARLLVAIHHEHVVSVIDAGVMAISDVSHPFYVMELLEGQSLKRLLASGQIELTRAIAIILQAAAALEAVHGKSIIHRDLKPDNIFLAAGDCVKVIDFGIAKVDRQGGARTEAGLVIGTPAYMAPEQAAGKSVDFRADVYSLGAVLYEMLTGEPPFGRDDFLAIFQRQATIAPKPPHELNAAVSPELSAIVLKAIARAPEERYASVEKLRVALTQACPGTSGATPEVTVRIAATSRRTLVVVVVVILVALGVVAAFVLSGREQPVAPKPTVAPTQVAPAETATPPTKVEVPTATPKPAGKGVKRRVRKVEEGPRINPDEVPGESGAAVRRRRSGQ